MTAALTDRELLELAAKAAGLRVKLWEGHSGTMCAIDDDRNGRMWMPLHDDGDALRLAVKLGLSMDVCRQEPLRATPGVEVRGYVYRRSLAIELASDNGASLEAATRRAIVRAAAEIGRSMP